MRMTLICAAAFLSASAATAQQTSQFVSSFNSTVKSPTLPNTGTQNLPAPGSFLGGGADCNTPIIIPAGTTVTPVPYDNTTPASGGAVTAPLEPLCNHNAGIGGQNAIGNEEWWSWTAVTSGDAQLSTCSDLNGVDTKVAIWADDCANIVANMTDPLACKDDDGNCTNFTTTVTWEITAGTTYLIQLGTFVGAGGTAPGGIGDFSITEFAGRPAGQLDFGAGLTGQTANSYGALNGGEIMWLTTFNAGGGETVMSVDAAFGSTAALAGGTTEPDGTPATIAIYQGLPGGLTLLTTEVVATAQTGLDLLTNFPLTTPVNVVGDWTVGVVTSNLAGNFVTPGHDTVNGMGRCFLAIDNTGIPIDLNDPSGAPLPPTEMQGPIGDDATWLLRVHTVPTVGAFPEFCFGDGGNQMGCTNCPCTNNAPMGSGGGCLNSASTSARLIPSGNPSLGLPSGSSADLRFGITGVPPGAFCILNSGDALAPGNMTNPCFGLGSGAQAAVFDGLRCAITNTLRHGGRSADPQGDVGVTNNPWGGEGGPPVGIGNTAGAPFVAGQTRFFQVINRDDATLGCMRGLNTSQAVEVMFQP